MAPTAGLSRAGLPGIHLLVTEPSAPRAAAGPVGARAGPRGGGRVSGSLCKPPAADTAALRCRALSGGRSGSWCFSALPRAAGLLYFGAKWRREWVWGCGGSVRVVRGPHRAARGPAPGVSTGPRARWGRGGPGPRGGVLLPW